MRLEHVDNEREFDLTGERSAFENVGHIRSKNSEGDLYCLRVLAQQHRPDEEGWCDPVGRLLHDRREPSICTLKLLYFTILF